MEPTAVFPDNTPTPTKSPTTEQPTYSEHNLARAAYLCVLGFECLGFDGLGFQFENRAAVVYSATSWHDETATVQPMLYEQEKSRLHRMKSRWEREHQSPDDEPEDNDGFFQLKHSFWRDPSISKNAKLVGASMASHANKYRISYPGMEILEVETHLKKGRITAARQELLDENHLKKHARHRPDGTFNGWEYEVTSKMVHPRRKK